MVRRLIGLFQAFVLIVTLAWSPAASALDPVMLLLLRMLRDKIIVSLADAAVEAALKPPAPGMRPAPAPPAGVPPPGLSEPEQIRFIVDRNFTYLSGADRDHVYRALMAAINDPANKEVRAQLIEEFTLTALAVGEAQRVLDKLSRSQKQQLAASAAASFDRLPPQERLSLLNLLEAGHAPIPQDLNAMLLRELGVR